ncbi:hypothetical protein ACIRBX_12210 [Kitasatospora sp. NPDC096147]|uniref:hypothetical protein n=1 Tax=Kitasatospora sp. NPDC096147 TaxID=3364093 RepID=UPI0037F9134B
MKRAGAVWAAGLTAVAAVVAVAVPATAVTEGDFEHAPPGMQDGNFEHAPSGASPQGGPGTGEVLPYPGPDGLIWIADWIGDGGAVTGGANPSGPPVTVKVGCQGGAAAGSVRVTFTAQYGDPAPTTFTVDCPEGSTGIGTALVTGEQGRSFQIGVEASAPDLHWGLTVTQPDA